MVDGSQRDELGNEASQIAAEDGPAAGYEFLAPHEIDFDDDGELFHLLGRLAQDTGREREARASFESAIRFGHPSEVSLGLLFQSNGRAEEAAEQYQAALDAAPDDPDALVDMGLLLLEEGRAEESLGLLRRAADVDPRAHWQLADALLVTAGETAALEALERAIAAGESRAYVDLVELKGDEIDLDDARRYLREASLAGSHVATSDLVALLVDAGRFSEAESEGVRAVEAGDELVLGPLASAYEHMNDLVAAHHWYAKAVSAGQEEYREDLERVTRR
jgi:Flp pilus assembly protein TadD